MMRLVNRVRQSLPSWLVAASVTEKLVLLAPVALWFSYIPTISFGRQSGTNLELSIAVIYAVVLALVGLPQIWNHRQFLWRQKAVWLLAVFVGWNLLSIIWSVNPLRSILVNGLWSVLFLDFLVIYSLPSLKKMVGPLMSVTVMTAVVMSLLAIIQVAYGAWFDWGLCNGCVARGFGFVRPSGFAIEPQFFGSLLIAPILLVSYRLLQNKATKYDIVALCLMFVALYLTLSRGALYAVMAAVLVQVVLVNWRTSTNWLRSSAVVVMVLVGSFAFGMMWHGVFTQLNPRVADGFYQSITKSINHLSLGKISLPDLTPQQPPQENTSAASSQQAMPDSPPKAVFDGYVAKSTEERTGMSQLALEVWTKNPVQFLVGVGAGGAGRAIFQQSGKTSGEFEIVQNEFLSVAVELGIVGVVLLTSLLLALCRKMSVKKALAWPIILGFVLQWMFFSGLPNALHIYFVAMLMFAIIDRVDEKAEYIS
ncbi:O-antigen ligase family protein [Candidatus Nanosynbacter sp. BB002]|uniref:O-antigen ligase family protein n=1 Tax=Candidatus Nanosynbacter sp. BB002 TaxID=3393757 RepID=UPI0030D4D8F7